MDLFEYAKSKTLDQESPLASRLRPTTLDEVVGQQHIIGKNTLLYRAIKADKLTSVIFYGPPGTGKTTLAKVIANTTSAEFTQINATVAGKKIWKLLSKKHSRISECTEENHPLHRRDSPFQQRPTGLSPSICRRRNHHSYRRNNRKSIL